MTLAVSGVSKWFPGAERPVLDRAGFEVAGGSLSCLLGPSGAGKTTLLYVIAGLLDPDDGRIELDGRALDGRPAHRRPMTLLMQQPRLFAHLDVADNVAFGLRVRRVGRRERRRRSLDILHTVGIAHLADRHVHHLSGGEQQRVALARALVIEPRLLLADEPFASVDQTVRRDLQVLLRRLQAESGTTVLMVTHDRSEADRIATHQFELAAGEVTTRTRPHVPSRRVSVASADTEWSTRGSSSRSHGTVRAPR